jgi:CubicO group peptidase (beta-lactamase class C family)
LPVHGSKFLVMKRNLLILTAFLACLIVLGYASADPKKETDLHEKAKKVDALFSRWNSDEKPGASVAVVHDGRMVYSKGFGLANLEYSVPNTPETIYHVASISKQFTVYAILLLEQQGKLSIDDDIRDYIPEVPDFGHKITLRHLANHTSGIRDQWNLLGMAGWRLDDVITKEHILRYTEHQQELNFLPGEHYLYSNTGFTLLGEVAARVSGMSFNEFAIKHIFDPLGMEDTFFYDDHEKIVPNRAYSYYSSQDNSFKKRVLSYANAGATSLFTTVEDLSRWAVFLNRPDEKYITLVEAMNEKATLNSGDTFGGALGQFVDEHKGLSRIQHGGADAGYRTFMARFPDHQFAVIVFSNYASFNPAQFAMQIADIYLADQIDSTSPEPLYHETDYLALDSDDLKLYEGHYVNYHNAATRNFIVRENILLYSTGNLSAPLVPVEEDLFYLPGTQMTVRFSNQNGEMKASVEPSQSPSEFVRETPVIYAKENLEKFTGYYFSEELQTTYSVILEDGNLIARHMRTGDINLRPVSENLFRGDTWHISRILFEKKDGKITGFRASGGRVWNLLFERISD